MEELEFFEIPVLAVLELCSQHRDPNPGKYRFLTPHFIVTVARGFIVSKLRAITSPFSLRVRWMRTGFPKGSFSARTTSAIYSNCQLPKPGDRSDFNTHKTC